MSIFQYFNYSKSEDLNNKWPPPLILGFSQKNFQAPGGENRGKNCKKPFTYENHAISASKPKGAILLA